jgi:pimeloyl-ACP methyl ester carboxylesterase
MKLMSQTFEGVGGVRLAADTLGDPNNPPVILLHGGGQTRWSWGASVQSLADDGFRVINVDLRGHGESDWAPGGDYGFETFTGDLRNILKAVGGKPFIVGASLGGLCALLTCGEPPFASVAGLVLVDIAPRIAAGGTDRVVGFMRSTSKGFASLEEAASAIAEYLPHRTRPIRPEGLAKNLRQGDDGLYRWHWDPAFIQQRPNWSPQAFEDRLMHATQSISVPILFVRGSNSDVLTAAIAKTLAGELPQAEFAEVAGAEHMLAGDENTAFTQAILPFLLAHTNKVNANE